jgi:hypothetical protein
MTIDIEGLEADPRFQAKSPAEREQFLNWARKQAAIPSLGERASSFYQRDIAAPATNITAHAIAHPLQTVEHPLKAIQHTKPEHLPPYAREVAEFVIPQTLTAAGLTAASLAMPEVGAERILGGVVGPAARMFGGRIARTAVGTGLGAAAGALTGEGAGQGAKVGAATFAPYELAGAVIGKAGRRLGEAKLIRDTTAEVGQKLESIFPRAGKLRTGTDFANAFIHGGAVNNAATNLKGVKDVLEQKTQGVGFAVPTTLRGVKDIMAQKAQRVGAHNYVHMSFRDADKLRQDLQQGIGYTLPGAPTGGYNAMEARELSFRIRDELARQLDKHHPGFGKAYLRSMKEYDGAKTLNKVFKPLGLIGPHGLNQPELIKRLEKASEDLHRALGPGSTEDLLNTLRRGFIGEDVDIPSKPGHTHTVWHAGILPSIHRTWGRPFDPIGKVPWTMRPQMGKVEATLGRGLGEKLVDDRREGRMPESATTRPKPEAAKGLVTKKPKEIHAALRSGELSHKDIHEELASLHNYRNAPLGEQLKQQDLRGLLDHGEKVQLAGTDLPVFYQALVRKYQQAAASNRLSPSLEKRYNNVLSTLRPRIQEMVAA